MPAMPRSAVSNSSITSMRTLDDNAPRRRRRRSSPKRAPRKTTARSCEKGCGDPVKALWSTYSATAVKSVASPHDIFAYMSKKSHVVLSPKRSGHSYECAAKRKNKGMMYKPALRRKKTDHLAFIKYLNTRNMRSNMSERRSGPPRFCLFATVAARFRSAISFPKSSGASVTLHLENAPSTASTSNSAPSAICCALGAGDAG
eukprot:4824340-Pyramimonas_sp.AAC.1